LALGYFSDLSILLAFFSGFGLAVVGFVVIFAAFVGPFQIFNDLTRLNAIRLQDVINMLELAQQQIDAEDYETIEMLLLNRVLLIQRHQETRVVEIRGMRIGHWIASRFFRFDLDKYNEACRHPLIEEKVRQMHFFFSMIGVKEENQTAGATNEQASQGRAASNE
jgi:hypothetical protein